MRVHDSVKPFSDLGKGAGIALVAMSGGKQCFVFGSVMAIVAGNKEIKVDRRHRGCEGFAVDLDFQYYRKLHQQLPLPRACIARRP